jgi:hypothetical protein
MLSVPALLASEVGNAALAAVGLKPLRCTTFFPRGRDSLEDTMAAVAMCGSLPWTTSAALVLALPLFRISSAGRLILMFGVVQIDPFASDRGYQIPFGQGLSVWVGGVPSGVTHFAGRARIGPLQTPVGH